VVLPGATRSYCAVRFAEVKTKVDEKSEARLDDTQALDALVSCFRNAEKEGQGERGHLAHHHLLSKRLVPGTLIDRLGRADGKLTPRRMFRRSSPTSQIPACAREVSRCFRQVAEYRLKA